MKNLLMVILLTLFTLSLAACGSGGSGDSVIGSNSSTGEVVTGTGGGTTTGTSSLGDLVDIGDYLGAAGDAWYDTETVDINLSKKIIGSSMDIPILYDPNSPDSLTVIPGHGSTYDDYYYQKATPSENVFKTEEVVKINDDGLIIGNTFTKSGESESRAFVYDSVNHIFIDLAPPNWLDSNNKRQFGSYSHVVDINENGAVVLTAEDEDGTWAYYWNGSSYDTVDDLQTDSGATIAAFQVPRLIRLAAIIGATGSEAVALNDTGQAVANSDNTAVFSDLTNSGSASLNSLGSGTTTAIDINNNGHVVGTSGSEGFFWRGGVMYPISNPSGASIDIVDINNNDYVVGNSGGLAFIWHLNSSGNGVFQSLGSLGGGSSTAVAMNDLGMVVGYSTTTNTYSEGNVTATVVHGFLWHDGIMYDLGAHSPPDYTYPFNPDFYFSQARAINEAGDVTGISYSINAHDRGFTLTPVFPAN